VFPSLDLFPSPGQYLDMLPILINKRFVEILAVTIVECINIKQLMVFIVSV
jgi:hypothetical protein